MEKNPDQKKEILIIPIGKVLVEILREIAVALRKVYDYHARIGRSEEPGMEAYNDARRQYDAEKLLRLVASRQREHLIAVLGVVDGDMFFGEKSFTFRAQQREQKVAVLALSRLREEFYKKPAHTELFLRRAVTEAIYQVGCSMGLPACSNKKCVLFSANTLWNLDSKPQMLCPMCTERLNKLESSGTPEGQAGSVIPAKVLAEMTPAPLEGASEPSSLKDH